MHLAYYCVMNKDFALTLKKAKLKVTPARQAILETFSSDCKPINAEYIHQKLKDKGFNLVTIYRTLTSLETSGLLKRVDLRKGSTYYELTDHHHHHVICTGCGKTESFEMCDVDKISKGVLRKSPLFETIGQHSLELFGTCKSCSKG